MNITISKWGNSLGIRIPSKIADSLDLHAGDQVTCEVKNSGLFVRKEKSTAQIFAEFYGKPFDQITQEDIGSGSELDWGDDVGGEQF